MLFPSLLGRECYRSLLFSLATDSCPYALAENRAISFEAVFAHPLTLHNGSWQQREAGNTRRLADLYRVSERPEHQL